MCVRAVALRVLGAWRGLDVAQAEKAPLCDINKDGRDPLSSIVSSRDVSHVSPHFYSIRELMGTKHEVSSNAGAFVKLRDLLIRRETSSGKILFIFSLVRVPTGDRERGVYDLSCSQPLSCGSLLYSVSGEHTLALHTFVYTFPWEFI